MDPGLRRDDAVFWESLNVDLKEWIGKSETVSDVATAFPYAALSATLDRSTERPPTGTMNRRTRHSQLADGRSVVVAELLSGLGARYRVRGIRRSFDVR